MKISVLLAGAVLFLFGCASPTYIANSPHTPFFKDKGEVNIGGSFGKPGFEAKTSVSLPANLFLFGSAAYLASDSVDGYRDKYFEGGAGYYSYLKEPVKIPWFVSYNHLELLAGYGSGDGKCNFEGLASPALTKLPVDYRKYFVQFNLGLSDTNSKLFNIPVTQEVGQLVRLSFLDYYKLNYPGNTVSRHLDNMFFEYFFVTGITYDFIKLGANAGISIPLHNKPEFGNSTFSLNISAMLNFNLY
jgi:hypothetical protein